MITTVSQDDCLSYFVVVHGIDIETYERLAVHFECRRGGMRVTDGSRYSSIPVTMAALEGTLDWVKTELGGRYCELYLIVLIHRTHVAKMILSNHLNCDGCPLWNRGVSSIDLCEVSLRYIHEMFWHVGMSKIFEHRTFFELAF